MARITLDKNVKYKRLWRELGISRPLARGHLEMMWDAANECGQPFFASAMEVEAAAEWDGEEGMLASKLLEVGLLDSIKTGGFSIHHYWHHAPEYVLKRKKREDARVESVEINCNGRQRQTTADNGTPPSPSPSPSLKKPPPYNPPKGDSLPGVEFESAPSEPEKPRKKRGELSVEQAERFARFWACWPSGHKAGTGKAMEAWNKHKPSEALTVTICAAVEKQKGSRRWVDDVIPNPATWLNQKRWLDELKPANEGQYCGTDADTGFVNTTERSDK